MIVVIVKSAYGTKAIFRIIFKVARGYFLRTEVIFSKSSFGHVNLNRLVIKVTNVQIL